MSGDQKLKLGLLIVGSIFAIHCMATGVQTTRKFVEEKALSKKGKICNKYKNVARKSRCIKRVEFELKARGLV